MTLIRFRTVGLAPRPATVFCSRRLQFELAARIRDEITELKKEIRQMDLAGSR